MYRIHETSEEKVYVLVLPCSPHIPRIYKLQKRNTSLQQHNIHLITVNSEVPRKLDPHNIGKYCTTGSGTKFILNICKNFYQRERWAINPNGKSDINYKIQSSKPLYVNMNQYCFKGITCSFVSSTTIMLQSFVHTTVKEFTASMYIMSWIYLEKSR